MSSLLLLQSLRKTPTFYCNVGRNFTKAVNNYTDYEQEINNRRRSDNNRLDQPYVTKVGGDPEFAHVRHKIKNAKNVHEIKSILENPCNHSTCVFGAAMQKSTKLNQFLYSKSIFDSLLTNKKNHDHLDTIKFNSLFQALGKIKVDTKQVLYYIDQMEELQIEPDHITLFSILQALRKTASFYTIMKIWKKFTIDYGVTPDNAVYVQLLGCCATNFRVKEAETYFASISKPNRQVYSSMLNVYAASALTDQAVKLLQTMIDTVGVSEIATSTLMKCYMRAKKPFDVLYIYDMVDAGDFGNHIKNSSDSLMCKAIAYKQIVELNSNLDDQIKYLTKLRFEIGQERKQMGLAEMDAGLIDLIIEALLYVYKKPSQWKKHVVPQFRQLIDEYKMSQYLNVEHDDPNACALVDLRRFAHYTSVFVVWYIFTSSPHKDYSNIGLNKQYYAFIVGKRQSITQLIFVNVVQINH